MIALQKIIIFLLLFNTLLISQELQQEYFINSHVVKLSNIIQNPKKDYILFNINLARHSKRVPSPELIKKLKSYGYNDFHARYGYIQFSQKSPISTEKLKDALKKYYAEKYKEIDIQSIELKPNRYMTHLPKDFTIGFSRNAYLSHKGILYIKTLENKKYFFDYTLLAKVSVYMTKTEVEKGEALSVINTQKKSIILDRFRAFPLLTLQKNKYETKHRLKKDLIITQRDITGLYLVRRGNNVVVTLRDGGVEIFFNAKASQNGRYGDTISVEEENNHKKIRVRISGRNRAEVK